jgi:hypothetical protein
MVQATPEQTNQGCQTEAGDYLVDIFWTEFGPEIYELPDDVLIAIMQGMGFSEAAQEAFLGLINLDGTLAAYFGPCCFKGGPKTYVDARNNGFPNDCCKPPDFSVYPDPATLGGGDGNQCLCQSGLHRTPDGKIYGGDYFDGPFVVLDGTLFLKVEQIAPEEWIVIPIGPA